MDKLFKNFRQRNMSSVFLYPKYSRSYAIGIDLGTTNSRVAIMQDNVAKTITDIPSYVSFKNGNFTVGTPAKSQAISNLTQSYFGTKRLIGRRFDESTVQKQLQCVPYTITSHAGDASLEADAHSYSPIIIAALILTKLRNSTVHHFMEYNIKGDVKDAVISVPASFTDRQRIATRNAVKKAGLEVCSIIDESTASAVVYALDNKDGVVAVVDIGGGSIDVAVIQIRHGDHLSLKVKAKKGDTALGGLDFDEIVALYLMNEFKRTDHVHLATNRVAYQRVRAAAEIAKIELSGKDETHVHIPFIIGDGYGSRDLDISLTRSTFEAEVNPLINRIKRLCEICLEDAKIEQKVDEVLLVGGLSHIPVVQQVVSVVFGRTPYKGMDPYQSVALGTALYGAKNTEINVEPETT